MMAEPNAEELKERLKAATETAEAAERKAEDAIEEASTAKSHLQAILKKGQARNLLLRIGQQNLNFWGPSILILFPVLPRISVQFLLKDTPDAAKIFMEQMRGFEQICSLTLWDAYNHECLGNLVILSELPPNGASLAIPDAAKWAAREVDLYYLSRSVDKLIVLDRLLLAGFHTMKSRNDGQKEKRNDEKTFDPQPDIDALLQARQDVFPYLERRMKTHMPTYVFPREIMDKKRSVNKGGTPSFLKKIWFPQTLKFLRGIRRKKVTNFLMPIIAKDKLPVELMDTIAGFYYGAEFMVKAAAVAKQTAAKYSSSGCNAEARALRW